MEITTMSHAMQLHAHVIKTAGKPENNILPLSKLLTFSALSPSANLTYARQIFNSLPNPNSYFWNTMIRAYSNSPDPDEALLLFLSMNQQQQQRPDNFTYPFLLKSCSRTRRTFEGKQFHAQVFKTGLHSNRFVQHSLIHMYSSCGESKSAKQVFDKMTNRDVVSWSSMIDGYVENDQAIEALQLWDKMQEQGIKPTDATVVSVLRACTDTGSLSIGQKVHRIIEQMNLESKPNVMTALIDMYAKCGSISSARQVFDGIENKDIFAWTAMISGLARHGHCKDAINLFKHMEELDVKPDVRTITAVLSACRNAGWVREGYSYFNKMQKRYGITPKIQHYGCMVDLLARAGHLNEVEKFIKRMPIKPDAILHRTLIWACKIHGDTERSERLADQLQLLHTDSNDTGSYVLLGNVYASAGKWQEKAKVRELMNNKGIVKPKGSSKIEVNGSIHEFVAGDSGHPDAVKIYRKLDEIAEQLREEGYQPKLKEVLLDIDDGDKACQLQHHSEKLAVAFGLINTSPGTDIRIMKNLRSCADCHSVMKLISKIYQREIIVRDRIRFHNFKDGECSCCDYW